MKRFFIIYICICICGPLIGQTDPDKVPISYSAYKKSLKNVLVDLGKKSGINISFNDALVESSAPITINTKNEPLGNILDVLLSDLDVDYKIVGGQLVLFKDDFLSEKNEDKHKESATISGYIGDASSDEKLIYANIFLADNSAGVVSNEYGFYTLTLPVESEVTLIYSYLGYKKQYNSFILSKDTTLNVNMDFSIELEEVIINDTLDSKDPGLQESNMVPLDKVSSMVGLGGVDDIIRTVNLLPGVTSGADGFGGSHVRGGNVDHNLILLDGVPVYNATHSLGLFSVFNSSAIKSARFVNGSFPAQYGRRLASVLDIRTREGNTQEMHGEFSLGLLSAKATLEGPIAKGKSGFLLSARRTFLDPWIKQFTGFQNDINDSEGSSNYYFYDINAKTHFKLGEKNKIFFSYYQGSDKFENKNTAKESQLDTTYNDFNENNWNWGNRIAAIRLNSQLSQKSFLNVTLVHSNFEFISYDQQRFQSSVNDTLINLTYNANLFESGIKDYGVKLNLDFVPNPSNYFRIGLDYVRHSFTPGLIFVNQNDTIVSDGEELMQSHLEALLNNTNTNATEFNAYIEDDIRFSPGFRANIGVRASYMKEDDKTFLSVQPRVSLMASLGENARFKTSFTSMTQNLHLVSNSGLGLPTDLWLPATSIVGPESAWQVMAGLEFDLGKKWSLTTEVYTKKMNNILSFNEGQIFSVTDDNNWENRVPVGEGTAKGFEIMLNKNIGKLTGWVNYTLSSANRKFPELNNGEEFRYRYDRRHYLKLAILYKIAKSIEFTMNWEFGSGNPITIPISVFDEGGIQLYYPERNNQTLPSYHKLDFGFNFYSKYSWGGMQKLSLGLYNAYNRKNPFYVDLQRDRDNLESYKFIQYSILPMLPAVSYTLSF
jgi:hypothetical protein